jgi:hypothetical protein
VAAWASAPSSAFFMSASKAAWVTSKPGGFPAWPMAR